MVLSRALAAAAVAVLLLAGCAPRGGVAAYVDGEPITEGTLAQTMTDLAPFSQAPARNILHALIVSPAWIEAARGLGVGVSEQEGRDLLDELARDGGLEAGSYGPGVVVIAQVLAAQEKASARGQGEALALAADALVGESEIEVNPRYGEWSGRGVAPLLHPWLVGLPPGIQ